MIANFYKRKNKERVTNKLINRFKTKTNEISFFIYKVLFQAFTKKIA